MIKPASSNSAKLPHSVSANLPIVRGHRLNLDPGRLLLAILVYTLSLSTLLAQSSISNTLTTSHLAIEGTKISLVPPIGFKPASNFLGLEQANSGATIMVLEIPGPFAETSKGMTKEGFLSQGIEVDKIEPLILNDLPAILVSAKQNAHGAEYTKYVLCFGTETETIIINGSTPSNLEQIAKLVKAALLTSVYEPNREIDPFGVVDYAVDLTSSKLKFAKGMSGSLIFTYDGNIPSETVDQTTLIIAKSFSAQDIEDRKLFCLNRLNKLPVEVTSIESTTEITIDGVSGFEIVADGKDRKSGEAERLLQVILFSDDLYYMFFGSTSADFDANIDEMRRVVKTFQRK